MLIFGTGFFYFGGNGVKMKLRDKQEFYRMLTSGKFAELVKESVKQGQLQNSREVYNVIKPLTAREPDVEQFYVIFLDGKNNVLEIKCVFKGSITSATVYPRELIKKVLEIQASAIVCCHNHPSGDPEPSPEDVQLTMKLIIALRSIDVTFHDHIVIGNGSFYSFADEGVMSSLNNRYNELIRG